MASEGVNRPAVRDAIFVQIDVERGYQVSRANDGKGWSMAFDDANTLNDWISYLGQYGARASAMQNRDNPAAQREGMLKVAAIAVAALEAFDRNNGFAPRHYDPKAPEQQERAA